MEAPLARQREMYDELCRAFAIPHPPGLTISDAGVEAGTHTIPIRLYQPASDGVRPCVLFLHGGSWMLGGLDSHDDITAQIAARTGATVVAVDYRLAPEHPYPAGLEDALTVLEHLASEADRYGIDPARLAVCGDSAGGNLAAALALLARDRGGPDLCGQVLIYPVLGVDFSLPAYVENAHAPLLPAADMDYYWRGYLGGPPAQAQGYVAPLRVGDLSHLPPAFIFTVQYDPLRDDGWVYANRLRATGTRVEYLEGAGLVHGCLRASALSPGAAAGFEAICEALREMLRTSLNHEDVQADGDAPP